ncbi:Disulphide bond corrector protein DsbC [Pedobacter westerhofensis]|uniref:Disulphide bond corrector protein DsbC n=1 Tax=Pedobacter westerhofensis TaxID=425512 RepID=A0A521B801_9SPHI|nr:protein-disulfide reductase DsbD domain-containing protein [Pedobacter westerhofensis]SMO43219.1 Disulphide bond corrector protein DsbC [Pedobacter westerhofensis]
MKKLTFLSFTILLFSMTAFSQILKPVTWSYAAKRTSATTATIYLKATIDQGWHLYSQYVKDGGPVKTSFTFPASKEYSLIGKTIEPKPISKFEPTFNMNVGFYENSVIFQQKIKLTSKSTAVKGTVQFMVCDDKQCLPPENIDFTIAVK